MSYGRECIFVSDRTCCAACSAYATQTEGSHCIFVEAARLLSTSGNPQSDAEPRDGEPASRALARLSHTEPAFDDD